MSDKEDSWIKHWWRPAIAWQYLLVCLFDFIIFPILTGLLSVYTKIPYVPWDPITLNLSGFYHISMAAIIGVAAFTRGQEKIAKINNSVGTTTQEPTTLTEVK